VIIVKGNRVLLMIKKSYKIINKLGIHARPAGLLVKTASRYKSSAFISNEGQLEVNAKSIMGVLMLGAAYGSTIHIRLDGEDEQEALKELEHLIVDRHFDEE